MKFGKAATAYVINDKKQILMLKHKKLNVWLPPGGHVEENELTHHAAAREVREETGVLIDFIYNSKCLLKDAGKTKMLDRMAELFPEPILVQLENIGDHYHEDFIYLAQAIDDRIGDIDENESREVGWFDFDQALQLETFEHTKMHLEYVKNMIK